MLFLSPSYFEFPLNPFHHKCTNEAITTKVHSTGAIVIQIYMPSSRKLHNIHQHDKTISVPCPEQYKNFLIRTV